jgi:hypothetical protein
MLASTVNGLPPTQTVCLSQGGGPLEQIRRYACDTQLQLQPATGWEGADPFL